MRSLLEAESLPELAVTLPDESNVLRWRVEMSVPAGCALRDEVEAHAAAFHVRPTAEPSHPRDLLGTFSEACCAGAADG